MIQLPNEDLKFLHEQQVCCTTRCCSDRANRTSSSFACVHAGAHAKLDLRQNAEGLYDVVGAREAHVAGIAQVRAVLHVHVQRHTKLLKTNSVITLPELAQRASECV